jgi:hypothetical protein
MAAAAAAAAARDFLRREFVKRPDATFFSELVWNSRAGITVALVSVPLSISLALAADAAPVQGVVSAFWASLVCGLFGSSDFNVVGPTGSRARGAPREQQRSETHLGTCVPASLTGAACAQAH